MPCPIGSKPSAARFAISSTRPTTRLPKRSDAPTVRTSYRRATSARCWRRRTASTCFSTTAPSSLIRRESSPAATRTRARARCPSAGANTSEDERFQGAAARWHARFVLEADLPLREAQGVMTLLCRLRGADRHIVRREPVPEANPRPLPRWRRAGRTPSAAPRPAFGFAQASWVPGVLWLTASEWSSAGAAESSD